MLRGIDISSNNVRHPDYEQLVAAGYTFVVIKLTGGVSYVNEFFDDQYGGALAYNRAHPEAPLVIGVYHYDGEPTVATGTADEEAAHFIDAVRRHLGGFRDDVFLALDAEERGTRDVARYRRWVDLVRDAAGRVPFLYTYPSFVTELGVAAWLPLADVPLWLASYGAHPQVPAPWQNLAAWQDSDDGQVPGVGHVDTDEFFGTAAQLAAFGLVSVVRRVAGDAAADGGVRAYLDDQGHAHLDIDFGGVADEILGYVVPDAGVVVGHAGERYGRSLKFDFQPWTDLGKK